MDFMEAIRLRGRLCPLARDSSTGCSQATATTWKMFRRNAGLMRCLNQLSIELPGFNDIGAQANLQLAHRVVSAFEREVPLNQAPERHPSRHGTQLHSHG